MRASFKVFDINSDGFIDCSELKQTLSSLGKSLSDHELTYMLETADTNNDGRIDYEGRGELCVAVVCLRLGGG